MKIRSFVTFLILGVFFHGSGTRIQALDLEDSGFEALDGKTLARDAVAGDPALGAAFVKMVENLIYARPLSAAELEEMIAMRGRIEKERGDPNDPLRDFKTGAGGLVDVEFLAQAQQLRHGVRHASLRHAATVEVLRAMPSVAGWGQADCQSLIEDYAWLRRLENMLRRDNLAGIVQASLGSRGMAPHRPPLGSGGWNRFGARAYQPSRPDP